MSERDGEAPHDAGTLRAAVTYAIRSRRSIRGFLPDPIAPELIRTLLELAGRAPSGSNIQPWRTHVLMGTVLDRVATVLAKAADAELPEAREYNYYPRTWRAPYLDRRRASGWALYQLAGVVRGDREGAKRQLAKNYRFFGAPVGLIFTIDKDLEQGSWLDYGMFLQTLMIAARGFGLETCPQAALANYPDLLRSELGISADQIIVCGMALGWSDPGEPTNALRTDRQTVEAFTVFHGLP